MKNINNYEEMRIAGIALDSDKNLPLVILKSTKSTVCLPIWIGISEAYSISAIYDGINFERPQTYDLFKSILDNSNIRVQSISIVALKDNVFIAEIKLHDGDRHVSIDARPSDAISIALKYGLSIFVNQKVLSEAKGVILEGVDEFIILDTKSSFSEFGERDEFDLIIDGNNLSLENLNLEIDLRKLNSSQLWEVLEEMEPEDFKYKM